MCLIACRTSTDPEPKFPDTVSPLGFPGCQSCDFTFREMLEACTRSQGVSFVHDDDAAREFDGWRGTTISCFASRPLTREEVVPADIQAVQQFVWRSRAATGRDLMIGREPLPGTKTYRIYRPSREGAPR